MDEVRPAGNECRVPIHHLTPAQVSLLRSLLNSTGAPYRLERGAVVTDVALLEEVGAAVDWVALDSKSSEVFDDPEFRSDRPPLVRPQRAALHDGRREATRWRRLTAGLIDELTVGVPTVLSHWAGAPAWTVAVLHAVYYVAPTALWGWTIGKLWCGIRVVDRRTVRTPAAWQATIRWLTAALPWLLGLGGVLGEDGVGCAVVLVHAPVMLNLRGLNDYAAGTLVVEKTAAGPGLWVRRSRSV